MNPALAEISEVYFWFLMGTSWSGIPETLTPPGAQFSHYEHREFPGHLFQPLGQCVMILPPPITSQTWELPRQGLPAGWQAGFQAPVNLRAIMKCPLFSDPCL